MEGVPPAPRAHLGWARLGAALVVRPNLWPTAARQARLLGSPAWRRFRMETQYGDPGHPPVAADALAWLEWCRAWRRSVPTPGGVGKFPARLRVQG
jgi:hypothetical protein